MALTVDITAQSVAIVSGIYNIAALCKVLDGTTVIFETTVVGKYNPNTGNLNEFRTMFLHDLRVAWDKAKAERQIFTSATLATTLGELETTATAYVNQ
jgi:hypothetical protein